MTKSSLNFATFIKQRAEVAAAYVNGDAEPLREIAARTKRVSRTNRP